MKFTLLYYGSALTLMYGVFHMLVGEGSYSLTFAVLAIPAYFLYSCLNDQLNEHNEKRAQGSPKSSQGATDCSDTQETLEKTGGSGSVAARDTGKASWILDSSGLHKGSKIVPLRFLRVNEGNGRALAIDAKSGYPPFSICFDNLQTDMEWTQLLETLSRREKFASDPERVVKCCGCGVRSKLTDFLPSPLGDGGVKCPLCQMNFLLSSER